MGLVKRLLRIFRQDSPEIHSSFNDDSHGYNVRLSRHLSAREVYVSIENTKTKKIKDYHLNGELEGIPTSVSARFSHSKDNPRVILDIQYGERGHNQSIELVLP